MIQDVTEEWLSPYGEAQQHGSELGDILHVHIAGESTERVVLLAHMDTVYPIGSWKDLWWVQGEHAYGPGTYDMKAATVQALWALRALRSTGREPSCSVDLLLTPDEEIGSDAGRPFIEKLATGAQAVLVLESPYMNGDLKIARKGVGDYRIDIYGKAAHQGLEPELCINPQLFPSDAQFGAEKRVFVPFCDRLTPDSDDLRHFTVSLAQYQKVDSIKLLRGQLGGIRSILHQFKGFTYLLLG